MFWQRFAQAAPQGGRQEVERLARCIDEADAVVVGAGAGLSTSAGLAYSGERFRRLFGDFEERYGFHDMYAGGFYPYETPEESWAFWSRYVMCNRYDVVPGAPYTDLLRLVGGKDYFVLTTNVDHQFQLAGFDKQRLFYTQGDYGLFQCSRPCCQRTWDNEDAIRRMAAEQRGMRIPEALVPVCPHCGAPAAMNLRSDDTFVQDAGWHAAAARYDDFLRRHEGMRTVYLELGVGFNTPVIVKYPFWQEVARNPRATYACIALGDALCPQDIAHRSILVDDDIGAVLSQLLRNR